MKILKNIFILILITNLTVSCTAEDINEDENTTAIENILATGEEGNDGNDETEKEDDDD